VNSLEIIKKKRDRSALAADEIRFMVDGYTAGEIPDYQISALLMAILINGMDTAETQALTEAMLHSGDVLDFSDIPGVKVDKHSTGGVGDKTSLILGPIAAAAGVRVPMISGRGLGHTGGTLDKLEAIPGFDVNLSVERFREGVERIGICLIGQTARIAPADKKIYALRDVTGTVESIPLITASIMSKKLAEGIDALVLDVKTGRGAFMKTLDDSRRLARSLVDTGLRVGKRMSALITDMNQPMGREIGNALEIRETIRALRGDCPEDLKELVLGLAQWMMVFGGVAGNVDEGRRIAEENLSGGKGLEKFRQMVARQGGDPSVVDNPDMLPTAAHRGEIVAAQDGWIGSVDTLEVGLCGVALGAGRDSVDAKIDMAVGFTVNKKIGDAVKKGESLLTVHYNDQKKADAVRGRLQRAFRIQGSPAKKPPMIYETVTP